jgi:ribosomal protein L24E
MENYKTKRRSLCLITTDTEKIRKEKINPKKVKWVKEEKESNG